MEQNQNTFSPIQRRDFPRYKTDQEMPISLVTTKNPQNPIQAKGHAINISQNGLCVKLDTDIPVSERVKLDLNLHNTKMVLNNTGRVVWSEPSLSLYGIDLTEYKESIPVDWFGYVAGFGAGALDRRERMNRRTKQTMEKKNRKIEDRRTDKPIFKKCGKNKMVKFLKKHNTWFKKYDTAGNPHAIMQGKKILSYSYCNYLGLSEDVRIKKAMQDSIGKYGTSINSSPAGCGTMYLHEKLEKKLAEFLGGEACILYPLGYLANNGILSGLAGSDDIILVDENSHSSIIEGCGLSKAKTVTYKHNNMKNLEKCLKKENGNKLIVSDGVFSMDGDLVKLDEVYELAKKYNAAIYLDDAHGIGIIGKNGRGTPEHFGLEGKIDLVMGTLAKAIPIQGGFVVGKKEIIDYLKYTSRPFIFNGSLHPYVVEGILTTLDIIQNEPCHREKLWENVHYMKSELIKYGFTVKDSNSAIIPIFIGDSEKTCKLGNYLNDNGIMMDSATYPIVKKSEAILRIVMSTLHTKEDIDFTIQELVKASKLFCIGGIDYV